MGPYQIPIKTQTIPPGDDNTLLYGDGSNLAITYTAGTSTMADDAQYTIVTVDTSGGDKILNLANYRFFAHKVIVTGNGKFILRCNGADGGSGYPANISTTPYSGGAAGLAGIAIAAGTYPAAVTAAASGAGLNGLPGTGNGTGNTGVAATAINVLRLPGVSVTTANGAIGAIGGVGGSVTGRSATVSGATTSTATALQRMMMGAGRYSAALGINTSGNPTFFGARMGSAGSGGGGAGSASGANTSSGAGGGAGGGGGNGGVAHVAIGEVYGKVYIEATGGIGGNGGGGSSSKLSGIEMGGGGGGAGGCGGSGGIITAVVGYASTPLQVNASGGNPGYGGGGAYGWTGAALGNNGSAGSTGTVGKAGYAYMSSPQTLASTFNDVTANGSAAGIVNDGVGYLVAIIAQVNATGTFTVGKGTCYGATSVGGADVIFTIPSFPVGVDGIISITGATCTVAIAADRKSFTCSNITTDQALTINWKLSA